MDENIIYPANPRAGYIKRQKEIDDKIAAVLLGGQYILGREVSDFEHEFGTYIGCQFCSTVASGTDALELALRACNIGPGDSVISVSHTAVATIAAVEMVGAAPIMVDVDPETYTIDLEKLDETLGCSPKVKAVIPIHLYGYPVDMDKLMDIAEKHDVYVIEDCAQSHGALFKNKKTGSFGDLGAFSCIPQKTWGPWVMAGQSSQIMLHYMNGCCCCANTDGKTDTLAA
jgi:dTDP-4-amino-4,6-dideoxygalactose transaminase